MKKKIAVRNSSHIMWKKKTHRVECTEERWED